MKSEPDHLRVRDKEQMNSQTDHMARISHCLTTYPIRKIKKQNQITDQGEVACVVVSQVPTDTSNIERGKRRKQIKKNLAMIGPTYLRAFKNPGHHHDIKTCTDASYLQPQQRGGLHH